ncbi:hypothetical protein Q7P37_005140 [Cladosporium fusiforme]
MVEGRGNAVNRVCVHSVSVSVEANNGAAVSGAHVSRALEPRDPAIREPTCTLLAGLLGRQSSTASAVDLSKPASPPTSLLRRRRPLTASPSTIHRPPSTLPPTLLVPSITHLLLLVHSPASDSRPTVLSCTLCLRAAALVQSTCQPASQLLPPHYCSRARLPAKQHPSRAAPDQLSVTLTTKQPVLAGPRFTTSLYTTSSPRASRRPRSRSPSPHSTRLASPEHNTVAAQQPRPSSLRTSHPVTA